MTDMMLTVTCSLKLILILIVLFYYLIRRYHKKQKKSTIYKLLGKIHEFSPVYEGLIDVNIDLRALNDNRAALTFFSLKMGYFVVKFLVLCTSKTKERGMIRSGVLIFLFISVLMSNFLLIIPSENSEEIIFLIGISLAIFLVSLGASFKTDVSSNLTIFETVLDEMKEPIALIETNSENKKSTVFLSNKKFLAAFLIDEKRKRSFRELNSKVKNFHSSQISTQLCTQQEGEDFDPLKTARTIKFENLTDIFSFYDSIQKTNSFLEITRLKDHPEKNSEALPDLKLFIKKIKNFDKDLFLLILKKIKKTQKDNQSWESKTRLLNSLSHELKTPLNGSITFLEILRSHLGRKKGPSLLYLENSLASLRILENTINNIIDYSLILADQFIICLSNVNLNTLMEEIYSFTVSQAQLKNLEYTVEMDGCLSKKTIYTDQVRLKQIILNVTLNAIQFTQQGSIKIELKIIEKKPMIVQVTVQDTGIGMEEEFCSNLMKKMEDENFEFQANSTGSCMGLKISNKLAILLGKRGIKLKSQKNVGTQVMFEIFDQDSSKRNSEIKENKAKSTFLELESPKIKLDQILGSSRQIDAIRQKNRKIRKKDISINSGQIEEIDDDSSSKVENNEKTVFGPSQLELPLQTSIFSPLGITKRRRSSVLKKVGFDLPVPSSISRNNLTSLHHISESLSPKSDIIKISSPSLSDSKKAKILKMEENIDCQCEEILIVDDDAFNLLSLELILRAFNLKCLKALHGKDALDKLAAQSCASIHCRGVRLIFMDYQMPVMDGVTCMKEIQKMIKNQERSLTVIGCTAFTTKQEVTECLNAGMKDVIFKPLNKEIVANILAEWLD